MSTITQTTPQSPSIYDDAVAFGQFKTSIMFYVLFVIGIVVFCFGIYELFFKKNKHSLDVVSKVRNATCNPIRDRYNDNYRCTFNVTYTYLGKTYQPQNRITITNQTPLHNDDEYTVYIDPENASDFSTDSIQLDHDAGKIMIFIGLLLIGMGYLSRWLAYRYRSYAALETVSTGANMIGGAFNRW